MFKRSKVWLHFAKVDEKSVRCNICNKIIAAKTGNTSNMMKHLTVHGINIRAESCTVFDCKRTEAVQSSSGPPSKCPPQASSSINVTDEEDSGAMMTGAPTGKQTYTIG